MTLYKNEEDKMDGEKFNTMKDVEYGNKNIKGAVGNKTKKGNIIKRLFFALLSLIMGYVIISLILISINPLFSWIVLYPIFIFQDIRGDMVESNIDNNIKNLDVSSTVMSSELFYTNCKGFLVSDIQGINIGHSAEYLDDNDQYILKYVDQVKTKSIKNLSYCITDKGEFIFEKDIFSNGSIGIYKVIDGILKEIGHFNHSDLSLVEDSDKNIFLIDPKSGAKYDHPSFYEFNLDKNSFSKIEKSDDHFIKICERKITGFYGPCSLKMFDGKIVKSDKESSIVSNFLDIKLIIHEMIGSSLMPLSDENYYRFGSKYFEKKEIEKDVVEVYFPWSKEFYKDERYKPKFERYMTIRKFNKIENHTCNYNIKPNVSPFVNNINEIPVIETVYRNSLKSSGVHATYKSYFFENKNMCYEIMFELVGKEGLNSEVDFFSTYIKSLHY
jgi:hypothetical protein